MKLANSWAKSYYFARKTERNKSKNLWFISQKLHKMLRMETLFKIWVVNFDVFKITKFFKKGVILP